jgi:hypothetical protein
MVVVASNGNASTYLVLHTGLCLKIIATSAMLTVAVADGRP